MIAVRPDQRWDSVIEAPLGRKAEQVIDACGRHQLTTCEHQRCRHQPRLHLEGIREERMEEGSRIGLANRLPGHKADGERDQRPNYQGNRQPSRIRPTGLLLETGLLAHAYPPLRHRTVSELAATTRRRGST